MKHIWIAVLAAALAACGGGGEAAGDEAAGDTTGGEEASAAPDAPLFAGTEVPDFTAPDHTGAEQTLSAERGHYVVLYFYPRDATPGCTAEACAFRDVFSEYDERGITLWGVSVDSVASHAAFVEEHELPFALISDEDGAITTAYGVQMEHEGQMFSNRITFLIDDRGFIRHVWEDVDPGVHADDVLRQIDSIVVMGHGDEPEE